MSAPASGGCQCGAVRYRIERLGRASICHCRMCQKATGGIFGAFAEVEGMVWTRRQPARFASSNLAERLFCRACGTPLGIMEAGEVTEITTATLDDPARAVPAHQSCRESRLPCFDTIADLPPRPADEVAADARRCGQIASFQHPDRDTDSWPPEPRP